MNKDFTIAAPAQSIVDRYAGLSADAWRWLGALALIALAVVLPFGLSTYHVFELTMVMIYAIAVLGLNILTGYNGQISLGHGGFFAVGAYTTAILMSRYGVPYWATLPPAALICFVLGVLFGLPALRFEGPYLALVTLAMAVATPQVLKYFDTWTGGQQGINLVKPSPPPGIAIDRDRWLYFVALVVLLLAIRIAANMLHGRTGRAWVAIRDHPIAAAAMGIDTARYKTLAFGTSTPVHRRGWSAFRHCHRLRCSRELYPVFVAVVPGGFRDRRHCDNRRRHRRWILHPIRAQSRQRHFRRRACGGLRGGDAAVHVRHAARRRRYARILARTVGAANSNAPAEFGRK